MGKEIKLVATIYTLLSFTLHTCTNANYLKDALYQQKILVLLGFICPVCQQLQRGLLAHLGQAAGAVRGQRGAVRPHRYRAHSAHQPRYIKVVVADIFKLHKTCLLL